MLVGSWMLVLLSACSSWPRLSVRGNPMTEDEMIRDAPIILIGQVLSQQVGPEREGWSLVKMDIAVENVLRGDLPGREAVFYFWHDGRSANAGSTHEHERCVFFLTFDHGVLRAVRDEWLSQIEVSSGRHRNLPLSPSSPLEERIAVMLLTPGEAVDATTFGQRLDSGFAERQLGDWRAAKLLKKLLTDPHREIRVAACEELTRTYWGQDSCWNELDFGGRAAVPPIAVSRLSERQRRQEVNDPVRWWKLMSARRTPEELLDQLRLLTAHKDPGIREKYCRFLESLYPGETDCGCYPPHRVLPGPVASLAGQKLRGPSATMSSTRIVSFTTNGSPYFTPMRLP